MKPIKVISVKKEPWQSALSRTDHITNLYTFTYKCDQGHTLSSTLVSHAKGLAKTRKRLEEDLKEFFVCLSCQCFNELTERPSKPVKSTRFWEATFWRKHLIEDMFKDFDLRPDAYDIAKMMLKDPDDKITFVQILEGAEKLVL